MGSMGERGFCVWEIVLGMDKRDGWSGMRLGFGWNRGGWFDLGSFLKG